MLEEAAFPQQGDDHALAAAEGVDLRGEVAELALERAGQRAGAPAGELLDLRERQAEVAVEADLLELRIVARGVAAVAVGQAAGRTQHANAVVVEQRGARDSVAAGELTDGHGERSMAPVWR